MINTIYKTYLLLPIFFNFTLRIHLIMDSINSYYQVCGQSPIFNEKRLNDYQREIIYPRFIVEFNDDINKQTIWSIKIMVIIFYTEINNYW